MSVHRVYYKDGVKFMHPVRSREEYLALRNSGSQIDIVNRVRNGEEKLKNDLVQMNYSCLPNDDGSLKGSKRLSNTVGMDIDHISAEEMQPVKERILSKKDELGLKMLEVSARKKGYHLVFTRHPEMTNQENLEWASEILGVKFDKGAKDITRVFFTTTASDEDLLYLDDSIFEMEELSQETRHASSLQGGGDKDSRDGACPVSETVGKVSYETKEQLAETEAFPDQYHGIPFETILKKYWEVNNRGFEPTEGDRDTLTFQLASDLRHICGKNFNWLDQVIPCYDGFTLEEKRAKIKSALNSKYEGFPQRLRDTLNALEAKGNVYNAAAEEIIEEVEPQSELSKLFASKLPPELPAVLPNFVKVVTQHTPKKYKATVAQAMFPPAATYPKDLSFVYIDNQERELRINCLIIAGTGTGKDSCTRKPLTRIIANMKARDEMNRIRLKKFNEEYNSKENNKRKPQRPDDLIIQTLKSDITKAALNQRMDEAQGAPLYVRLNELEQWDQIEGSSGRNNQFTTMKLCDDEGNEFGSDRASAQSVMASGCLHLNWNANTTCVKVTKYFANVMTDGPISRLCLATIPDEEIGADIAVFGHYDKAYDEELKPFIDNLKEATGVIDCPQAKKLARKLKNECAEFAQLSQDRVFDNLSHRALVAAFRKACLLYVANGRRWEKAIENFCRWSLFYDLYLKMHFFGDLIRRADGEVRTSRRGPQSLLELLPDEFTMGDAERIRLKMGLSNEGKKCSNMIRQWQHRNYVLQLTVDSFKKVSK